MKLYRVGKAYINGFIQWLVYAEDAINARLYAAGEAEKEGMIRFPERKAFLESLTVVELELKPGVLFSATERLA